MNRDQEALGISQNSEISCRDRGLISKGEGLGRSPYSQVGLNFRHTLSDIRSHGAGSGVEAEKMPVVRILVKLMLKQSANFGPGSGQSHWVGVIR
ncbi:hypothetical protein MesoLj113b_73450 (plasmid) [Mesorhizobium sp. 113-3-3]|nr:hypothetical protein MesoLj113b_73450 [Mesorhizobium sp. 113-3-3]